MADQTDPTLADIRSAKPYREVTVAAIVFAIVIGLVMNASITYAGLRIGFTIGGSAIAAVVGFGILRGIMRKGTILETNIAQTVASAVNTSNSGIIFTVPAVLLLGYSLSPRDSNFWLITLGAMAGAVLGAAFIIPLRKQMIDIDRLRFPTGTGVAVILKSPGAGAKKAIVLGVGIAIGALVNLPAVLPQIKLNASVDQLDTLFEHEKISHDDVMRTRAIAGWIEAEAAPETMAERGHLLADRLQARAELRAARIAEELTESIENRIASLDQALGAETAQVPAIYSDELLIALHGAITGERNWRSLKSQKLGWAGDPLPGYADLGIRMKRQVDESKPATDLDGDGVPDQPLLSRVDLDNNGHPDLLVTDEQINVGRMFGLPAEFMLVFAIAPFAIGAGYITGRPGLLVLAGGILTYLILGPLTYHMGWVPETIGAGDVGGFTRKNLGQPLGVGLLLGGAVMGILASLPAIRAALKSIAASSRIGAAGADELGLKPLTFAIAGAVILLFVADLVMGGKRINDLDPVTGDEIVHVDSTASVSGYTIAFTSPDTRATWDGWTPERRTEYMKSIKARPGLLSWLPGPLKALCIALIGAAWIWLAGIIIAQCTGMTDWSPISGIALLTVVLILLLAGTGAVVGAVMIGAALCVAITLAADMMQDLKTGQLVGAKPRRQQITELAVVAIGPLIAMLTVLIIAEVNTRQFGVAMGGPTPTPAPQAVALRDVVIGVQGGQLPYALYGFGALLGALLGLGAFSGLGVLVGLSMYLPFFYISTYGIGCIINMIVGRLKGRRWAEDWGVPLAAGLIVGDSLLGLVINIFVLSTS